jgi:hypothetical protein
MNSFAKLILLGATSSCAVLFAQSPHEPAKSASSLSSSGRTNSSPLLELQELASTPDDGLIIAVDGKELSGDEKATRLSEWRKMISQMRPEKEGRTGAPIALSKKGVAYIPRPPAADTPAGRAGLMQGDEITAIDGRATQGMSFSEIVDRIRGDRGTTVTLTITRLGLANPFDTTITREEIKSPVTPSTGQSITVMRKLTNGVLPGLILYGSTNIPPDVLEAFRARTNGAPPVLYDQP